LACQEEFFVNNLLDVKERDEHILDFALHLSCIFFFGLSEPSMPLSIHVGHTTAWVSDALFPRFAQNLLVLLCCIHREIASGQIHDLKCTST
jgi:hypothetical protein